MVGAMDVLEVGSAMPDLALLGPDENEVALRDLWRERLTLVVFLRHFGCPVCLHHLVDVQRGLGEFEKRGAQVVAIGQGTGAEAARVARMRRVAYPVLGDPGKASYRALGLGRTGWWGLTLAPFFEDFAGSLRNLRDADLAAAANPRSDVRQLGGVVLVDRAGVVRYLHRSRKTTDVPSNETLLAAIDALAVSA
jgi:peroxiredoxin